MYRYRAYVSARRHVLIFIYIFMKRRTMWSKLKGWRVGRAMTAVLAQKDWKVGSATKWAVARVAMALFWKMAGLGHF